MDLSICLPVSDNEGFLRDCLHRLAEQKKVFQDTAEIIVFDRSPEGDARIVATEAAKEYSELYYQHEPQTSPTQMIRRCAEMARGRFVWVVSGLELITPGTMVYLQGILKSEKFSENLQVVALNHSSMSVGGSTTFTSHDRMMDDISLGSVGHFPEGLSLLEYFNVAELRFPACLVLNREVFLSMPEPKQSSLGRYAHLQTVVRMCAQGGSAFAPRLCLMSREETVDDYDDLSLEEIPRLYEQAVELGFRQRRSSRAVKRHSSTTIREYVRHLRKGDFESTSPKRMFHWHGSHLYYWTTMIPIWCWYRLVGGGGKSPSGS